MGNGEMVKSTSPLPYLPISPVLQRFYRTINTFKEVHP
jgi:hypothetical protein